MTTTRIPGQFTAGVVTLADAATITLDGSLGTDFLVTIAGDRTLAFTKMTEGVSYWLWIIQGASGSHLLNISALTIGTTVAAPTLSTTAGLRDCLGLRYRSSHLNLMSYSLGYAA